jgi:hypothetical protein
MHAHVDAHFSGTIAPRDERTMRTHLDTCESCRTRYRRRLILAKLDPQSLAARERIAQGLGLRKPRRAARLAFPIVGAIFAAAAAVLLLVRGPSSVGGFSPRGEVDPGSVSPVHVYRVPSHGGPQTATPALDSIRRGDELAFAYDNPDGRKYLMIFAVDEQRRIYWFYPAWTDPADDPSAVMIAAGSHELPEAVSHGFVGSEIEVHSLFLDQPMRVRAIERTLATDSPLRVPGGVDHVQHFRVEP